MSGHWAEAAEELNRRILNYNLKCPRASLHLRAFDKR